MTRMNALIFYSVVLISAVSLFVRPFFAKYRAGPQWIRFAYFFVAILAAAWSGVGFFLVFYRASLTRLLSLRLDHLESTLIGMVLGVLILLFLSSEYRKLRWSSDDANV
jgi:hypothetical protein